MDKRCVEMTIRELEPAARRTNGSRRPVVSVVIPCYNYGRFLSDSVGSVLSQVGVEVKILIIDDASTDDSAQVARQLVARSASVELIIHPVNRGHIATYNEGLLEWATGDYVLLLSADDMLAPGYLERAVDLMERRPSVGLVYGRPREFTSNDDLPTASHRVRRPSVWSGQDWFARRWREAVNVVSTPTALVRRSVQTEVGGYSSDLPHAADLEMWLRIALVSDIAFVRGVTAAYYRVHRESMSAAVYEDRFADVVERSHVFSALMENHGGQIRRWGLDEKTPGRALASEPLWALSRAYEKGDLAQFPSDWVIHFAANCYPDLYSLKSWRAYKRRRFVGERLCHSTQAFAITGVVRRAHKTWWWWRWRNYGG